MLIMLLADAPSSRPLLQGIAAALGLALVLLWRLGRRWRLLRWLLLAVLFVSSLLTLAFPAIEGVRRWVLLGPIQVQPASLLLPLLLLIDVEEVDALRRSRSESGAHPKGAELWHRKWAWSGVLLLSQGVVALQPDAASASAFAAGMLVSRYPWRAVDGAVALLLALLAVLSWLRPNPLAPSDFAEDILQRALDLSPLLFALGLLSLLLLTSAPVLSSLLGRQGASVERRTGLSLSLYFGLSSAAVLWANYPIPVLGFGPSPLIGAILAVGILWQRTASPTLIPPLGTEQADSSFC
jgi:cell division protein FtsW (lipid II flippase)